MLKHHNANQRQETLEKLTQYVLSHTSILTTSTALLLKLTSPLILDESSSVRDCLYRFLEKFIYIMGPELLEPNIGMIFLYTHSGMTHITPSIRNDSTKFLSLLINACKDRLSSSAISLQWKKTLECFTNLLGWNSESASVKRTTSFSKKSSANMIRHLTVCNDFLQLGLNPKLQAKNQQSSVHLKYPYLQQCIVIHPKYEAFRSPCSFAYLSLFNPNKHDLVDNPTFRWQTIYPLIPGIIEFIRNSWSDACPVVKDGSNSPSASKVCRTVLSMLGLFTEQVFSVADEPNNHRKKISQVLRKINRDIELININYGTDSEWRGVLKGYDKLRERAVELDALENPGK